MPYRKVCSCTSTTYTILCTTTYSCFELFKERNYTSVCYFASPNLTVNCSNTSCVDSYSCSLRRVASNSHIRTKNGIKGIVTINKYTTSKLSKRGADACHDWRRDIDFKKGSRIVVSPYILHTCSFWILCKQSGRNHHIHHLR